jgi:hypothetical protein
MTPKADSGRRKKKPQVTPLNTATRKTHPEGRGDLLGRGATHFIEVSHA